MKVKRITSIISSVAITVAIIASVQISVFAGRSSFNANSLQNNEISSQRSQSELSNGSANDLYSLNMQSVPSNNSMLQMSSSAVQANAYVTMKIGKTVAVQNGLRTTIDNSGAKPFKVNGKTMIPLRFLGEKLGGKVTYVSDSAPITMTYGNKIVSFTLGKSTMNVNSGGKLSTIKLEVAARVKDGRTYIPLRAVGQALGFKVYYESSEERIVVSNYDMGESVLNSKLLEYKYAEQAAFDEFVDLAIQYAQAQPRYPVKNGKTIYAQMFGNAYAQWCTEFVMWCFRQAENELHTDYIGSVYPWKDSSGGCTSWFKSKNRLHYRSSGYVPKRGDMIFYNYGTGGNTDHTGLVIGTETKNGETYVKTIEGNIPSDSKKQIRTMSFKLNDKKIVCYGSCR